MKLISCHIENYGMISAKDIDLSGNFLSVCEANGFGKSTIASFLKAMFFGLDSVRSGSKNFVERKHYYPFTGGAFGGSVTFLYNGDEYKIERFFDEKSETEDTLTVYRNKKLDDSLGENIGEAIFGLDKQSFERTAFITAEDIEIATTGSINSKLNNFVAGSNDDSNLEAALERLDKKSKEYKKQKQGNDLLTEQKDKIKELNDALENTKKIAEALPAKRIKLGELNRELASLQKDIESAHANELLLRNWKVYDGYCKEASDYSAEARKIAENYPAGMPDSAQLSAVKEAASNRAICKAKLEQASLTKSDCEKLENLQKKFTYGLPEESALTDAGKAIAALADSDNKLATLEAKKPSDAENKLKQRFLYRQPDDGELAKLKAKTERFKELDGECRQLDGYSHQAQPNTAAPTKKGNWLYITLAIVAALLLITGVALLFIVVVPGAVLAGVGILALLADGFLYLNKKSSASAQTVTSDNPEKLKKTAQLKDISDEITAIVMPYGYTAENGVLYAANKLIDDVQLYVELRKRENESNALYNEKLAEREKISKTLREFFSKYGCYEENYINALSLLRSDVAEYKSLMGRRQASASDEKTIISELEKSDLIILPFIKKYGEGCDVKELLPKIESDIQKYNSALKNSEERKNRAESFKNENKLETRPDALPNSIDELTDRQIELTNEKSALLLEIEGNENDVELLDEQSAALEEAKIKLDEYKKTHDLLEKTKKALKEADEKLKEKYIRPVRSVFINYSTLLEKALGEKLIMNSQFELRFERNGKERSEKHLSSGQKSICTLCFRLALIENMYSEEKPFLILDDPFVHLDEGHLEKVKDVIKTLSQKMQIIYFTCHTSRDIQ